MRGLAMLICVLALASCQTNRVIQRVGAFGNHYTEVVTRPYVHGGGDFCGSSVESPDRIVWYSVFTRASAAECEALIAAFDTTSDSRDPFLVSGLLNCRQTGPYECERAVAMLQGLAASFAADSDGAIRRAGRENDWLSEFYSSDGRLITRVFFGFESRRPLSLECAQFTRMLDDDGNGSIDVTACRDATRSWVVDVEMSEV